MFLARVTGSVVATQKVASMTGQKLLTVEPYRVDEKARDRLVPTGRTFVVVDTLGAGLDEMVLICQGSSARLTPETEKLPIDAVVIGLVDTVDIGGQVIFSAHGGHAARVTADHRSDAWNRRAFASAFRNRTDRAILQNATVPPCK